MTETVILAVVPTWTSSWLTPLWIVGVGALLAFALLMALWLVAYILSRNPALSSLAEAPGTRNRLAFSVAGVMFALLGGLAYAGGLFTPVAGQGGGEQSDGPMIGLLILLLSILLGFAAVCLISRRAVDEVPDAVREGPLVPLLTLAGLLAAFGVFGYFIATTPREILASLSRLPSAGTRETTYIIPALPPDALDDLSKDPPQHPIDVDFRRQELQRIRVFSTQNLSIDSRPSDDLDLNPLFKVTSNEELFLNKPGQDASPFPEEHVTRLYVRNYGAQDASLRLIVTTAPPHPEASTIVITAISIAGVILLYLLQRFALPKISAVSLSTFKSELAQPLFLIVVAAGIVALVMFIFLPYNTLGEDIKVLKDSGMTLILVLGIIQAVWAASTSISEEIEGRTALTVLSKPIGRRSFIIGKFLGIFWTVAVIFAILGVVFMVVVAYKPIFDAKENSKEEQEAASWQICHFEMVGVVPGLALGFMETAVLAALSVAVSTRLPMLANFIICFSIYVLGHLTPLIVQSSVGKFAPVQFVAELSSAVLPILDHFNITTAVATGIGVPYQYLGWALVYSLLYGVIALLLALLLFEDRDLA